MSAVLTNAEQNELHALLRQQGNLTQDGCWDAIEVFEKFLKEKHKPLTDENVCEILLKKEWKGFVQLVRIIEKEHGIGERNE